MSNTMSWEDPETDITITNDNAAETERLEAILMEHGILD